DAVNMTLGILSGLEHLHSKKIIHRDLKPDNILLQGTTPRLADFGLARLLKTGVHSGIVAGTPSYMAPEAFEGKRSEQTDIWSAGVILYQLLTGKLPFPQTELIALLAALLRGTPETLPPTIPLAIQAVIDKALQKEMPNRFHSAAEMRTALQSAYYTSTYQQLEPLDKPVAAKKIFIDKPSSLKTEIYGDETLQIVQAVETAKHSMLETRFLNPERLKFRVPTIDENGKLSGYFEQETEYFTETVTPGLTLEMVSIPAGTFLMGSAKNEAERTASEQPQHEVVVTPFFMSRYPITQAIWSAIVGYNPSKFKGDNLPVENVSWNEATEFCSKLSAKADKNYRLPTEAEWEYAARGGSLTAFAFGNNINTDVANYNGLYPYRMACREKFYGRTRPVDFSEFANQFGLCDMYGNVWEWCQDFWHENYIGAPSNSLAWLSLAKTTDRVVRGGSWMVNGGNCRSAYRTHSAPETKTPDTGFRIVFSS
ncbi:MAG: SUMF1/EgtB/PvdO family nonheme iron enzyme, partial [Blastocatellia bacterium]|nr:SUMF1/EgtB/PvdO family nonheme iron enzyme [Blastocatellia bacterium]